MHLQRLILSDFKNIREADLLFSSKMNCFLGNNGAGKTNLLDAIYYLSMTKSYFGHSDTQSIRFGASLFSLSGHYVFEDALQEHIVCTTEAGGLKCVRRNGKNYSRFSEHLGLLPLVVVSPSDTLLIHAPAEERRRFMNVLLSQMNSVYMAYLQQYNQVLAQRNHCLRQEDYRADIIEALDAQLAAKAELIYGRRADLCALLGPQVSRYYGLLSGHQEETGLAYKSDLAHNSLLALFDESRQKDRLLRYTTCGIHRDDVVFRLNEHPIRRFGSQGQQKTFLVALKLAQFEIMKQHRGIAPLLLLDDVFDKLDVERVAHLLELVVQTHFGQIFITDSNTSRIEGVVHEITNERAFFDVAKGVVNRLAST
ncbi:MAG: DNA replication/repair protein RecF [Bacteroidales bacterium]|nr:DNA replication/repair protein RecF [Bacteroidales bacterium]